MPYFLFGIWFVYIMKVYMIMTELQQLIGGLYEEG
jgi:hypothetical protein